MRYVDIKGVIAKYDCDSCESAWQIARVPYGDDI